MLCSSLTYNAKEITMLLKEDYIQDQKHTVEWIVIDPASWTGNRSFKGFITVKNADSPELKIYFILVKPKISKHCFGKMDV